LEAEIEWRTKGKISSIFFKLLIIFKKIVVIKSFCLNFKCFLDFYAKKFVLRTKTKIPQSPISSKFTIILEAYNILGCAVVLDSAEIALEINGTFQPVPYNTIGETLFVERYSGSNAITRVCVGFTEDGVEVQKFVGQLEGVIGPPQGNRGFGKCGKVEIFFDGV
jgi:hypothetical protein